MILREHAARARQRIPGIESDASRFVIEDLRVEPGFAVRGYEKAKSVFTDWDDQVDSLVAVLATEPVTQILEVSWFAEARRIDRLEVDRRGFRSGRDGVGERLENESHVRTREVVDGQEENAGLRFGVVHVGRLM